MNRKIIFYLVAALIIIVAVIFIVRMLIPLKLISISPANNQQNIGTDEKVIINFNKNVSKSQFTLDTNPETKPKFQASGKTLNVTFDGNLQINQEYVLTLKSKTQFTGLDGQKSSQYTWKFNTGIGVLDQIYDTDMSDFYKQYPLARYIPYDSEHFSIDGPDKDGAYTISLYAIFNAGVNGPPIADQERAYHEQLASYKKESLDWIRSNGIDPNTLKIYWSPEEAANY